MIPIHEIPDLEELRHKVAELNSPFRPEQIHAFLNLLKTTSIVSRALDEFFARFDLTLPRFAILALLFFRYQEGLTSSEMAAKRSVSKATLSSLLDSLSRDRLIVREPDPNDRRRQVIRLTTVGFSKMERLVPEYQVFLNRVIGQLKLDEIEHFLPVLKKFEAFGEAPETSNANLTDATPNRP